MKRCQKFFLFPLLLLILLFPFISAVSVSAQAPTLAPIPTGTWYRPSLRQFREKVVNSPDDELFAERYVFAQLNWIIHSLTIILEFDVTDPAILNALRENLSQNPADMSIAGYANLGPTGFLILSMAEMYSARPASGIDSISSTLAKFSIAPPVHAQASYGYSHLTGVQFLWSATRNTAYLVVAVLLVVAGFMVMLRTKINPQAVVTIQLVIPRLIMALILITFSYAIAGLVIDLVYFIVAIFISALNTTGVIGDLSMALNWFVNPGFYKIFLTYMFIYINYTMDPVSLLLLFPSLLGLVMMVVVFFLLLRIWWMMMKAYITFMLLVIIGPWQIMLGVLPGRSGFASWFRNILAQASVFAVVPIVFIINLSLNSLDHFNYLAPFAELITWIQANITYGGLTAGPSGGELPSFPLFHSPMTGFFVFLTTFALLALMPKISDMVRDAIKAPKFPYGSAFGEALGPVAAGLSLTGYAGAGSRAVADAIPAGKTADLLRAYGTAAETISKKAEGAAKTLKNNI